MKHPQIPREASFPTQSEDFSKNPPTKREEDDQDTMSLSSDRENVSVFLPQTLQGSSARLDVGNDLNGSASEIPSTPTSAISKGLSDEIHTSFQRRNSSRNSLRKLVNDSQGGKSFKTTYEQVCTLGEGGFATVFKYQHKENKSHYAVKEIFHEDYEMLEGANSLKEEIAAMKCLRESPYIVRLFDVFEEQISVLDGSKTYLVMEEMEGGDLLDRITEKRVYAETDARAVARSLLQAVRYMHNKGIAHRDIKPENILLLSRDDDTTIKLCDFGCAAWVTDGPNCLQSMAGSPQYAAPEVYNRTAEMGYGKECDLWSVGVVLYVMLGGYAPFEAETVYEIATLVCDGDWQFHDQYWSEISQAPKDLITGLLTIPVPDRLTSEQALESDWLKRRRRGDKAAHASDMYNRSNSDRNLGRTRSGSGDDLLGMVRNASFDNISLDDMDIKKSVVAPMYISLDELVLKRKSSRDEVDKDNDTNDNDTKSLDTSDDPDTPLPFLPIRPQPPLRIPMFWATSDTPSTNVVSHVRRERRSSLTHGQRLEKQEQQGKKHHMQEMHFVRNPSPKKTTSSPAILLKGAYKQNSVASNEIGTNNSYDENDNEPTEVSLNFLPPVPDLGDDDTDDEEFLLENSNDAAPSQRGVGRNASSDECGKVTFWTRQDSGLDSSKKKLESSESNSNLDDPQGG